jgi:hypothetical protein
LEQSNDTLKQLYTELRNSRGKIVVFFGAGSSFDYGIPTMNEMADILVKDVMANKSSCGLSESTLSILSRITGIGKGQEAKAPEWNIEQLISRLHQIKEAIINGETYFVPIDALIGKEALDRADIEKAEDELIQFMARLCDFDACEVTTHGDRSIAYIAEFLQMLSAFQNMLKIFTTNIDLCIEAAAVRLSHQSKNKKHKEFILVDGFTSGPIPKFDIRNYLLQQPKEQPKIFPIFLWKLHGSIDWTFSLPFDDMGPHKEEKEKKRKFRDDAIICRQTGNNVWNAFYKAQALTLDNDSKGHKIIIFPTPDKYFQTYSNPYIELYETFRRELEMENNQVVIAVGTSFPDQHIRSAFKSFIQRDNTSLYIIDPDISLTPERLTELFGSSTGIHPVINMGFKEFIGKLQNIEDLKEEEE